MFIGRTIGGQIYGTWTSRQPDDADHPRQEEVADDHPDLVAYNASKPPKVDRRALAIEAMLAKMALELDAPIAVTDYVNTK